MNPTRPITPNDPLAAWENRSLYVSFAERAVECEQHGAWTEAALLWHVASGHARQRDNIHWAQGRAEYCRHQSGDVALAHAIDSTHTIR
ncbi:ANR family transcriptional regulator [Serratia proteamaculans]